MRTGSAYAFRRFPLHPIPKKACLTRYPTEERYGLVWVCLADKPRAPVPDLPMLNDPSLRVVVRDRRVWQCTAARAIENFLDLAHIPWVHDGTLGDHNNPLTPDVTLERLGEELRFTVDNVSDRTHAVSCLRTYRTHRPFSVFMSKEEPGGNTEIMWFSCTPHSARACTRCILIARNFDPPPGVSRIEDIEEFVIAEDQMIVENQRPEELPLDLSEEFHLKGPDAAALAYRRMMRELGVEA